MKIEYVLILVCFCEHFRNGPFIGVRDVPVEEYDLRAWARRYDKDGEP